MIKLIISDMHGVCLNKGDFNKGMKTIILFLSLQNDIE